MISAANNQAMVHHRPQAGHTAKLVSLSILLAIAPACDEGNDSPRHASLDVSDMIRTDHPDGTVEFTSRYTFDDEAVDVRATTSPFRSSEQKYHVEAGVVVVDHNEDQGQFCLSFDGNSECLGLTPDGYLSYRGDIYDTGEQGVLELASAFADTYVTNDVPDRPAWAATDMARRVAHETGNDRKGIVGVIAGAMLSAIGNVLYNHFGRQTYGEDWTTLGAAPQSAG